MFRKRTVLAMIGIMLACTLLSGGLVHALVPHSHGDDHRGEAPIWIDLHGSLLHDAKKFLAIVDESLLLFVIALIVIRARRAPLAFATVLDPIVGEPLRRGIHAHRAFR